LNDYINIFDIIVQMKAFTLLSIEEVCMRLGSRIKRLRLAQNLTQQQLADMANSSLSSIRRLEGQGQGGLELMVSVAQALQAIDHLDNLFQLPVQTIAQAEREQVLATRQRARLPRSIGKPRY
jgi:transcriptional regulator with XRE-family HTH domain